MKSILVSALLISFAAAHAQTVIQDDFDTLPSVSNDGRDGWRHNVNRAYPADNYTGPIGQGDVASAVLWKSIGGANFLLGQEAGAGSGDWFIAPTKFLPNAGDFSTLNSAAFDFKVARVSPAAVTSTTTTVTTTVVTSVRIYGAGSDYIQKSFTTASFPSSFWTAAGLGTPVTLSLDLKDANGWTNGGTGTYATVMNAASQIAIYFDMVSGAEQEALDDVRLTYNDGTDHSVLSDFEATPVIASDGLQGWKHNLSSDGFPGFPQGDAGGYVFWSQQSYDSLANGLVTSGLICSGDPAQGIGDQFVAPARYVPLNGRFDMMSTGNMSFDFMRFIPVTAVSTSSYDPLDVVTLSTADGYLLRYRISTANLVANTMWGPAGTFFAATGINRAWPFSADLTDKTKFTISKPSASAPTKSIEEIMANIAYLLVDGEIRSGQETNGIDNVKLEYTERAKITGTMAFGDRTDSFPAGAVVQFMTPGSTTVVYQAWATRANDGSYVLPQATPAGIYDLVCDPGLSFLKRKVANVNNSGSDLSGINFTFQNGDVDNSGEVDAIDIDLVIAGFGAVPTDAGFNPSADVDGSAEVDAIDIDIVISNFGGTDN